MTMPAPVVYIGSSIAPEKVRAIIPDAQIMPPIQRGHLYRDRMLGFTFFVIIDGVFFNDLAISPREIIDVLNDGATIVGASSMGAIRAAECWPAGMRGVGSIYRLFRRGSLDSDEEVAVTFGPVNPHLVVSVPLVNVRYATARLVRLKTLGQQQADRILSSAKNIFYAKRHWNNILRGAGIDDPDGKLKRALRAHDLKLMDATRAVRRAASMLAGQPGVFNQRRSGDRLFIPNSHVRERSHDALAGTSPEQVRPALWRWLVASGRVRRIPALTALLFEQPGSQAGTGAIHVTAEMLGSPYPERAWKALLDAGELDAAVLRHRAIGMAANEARMAGRAPTTRHQYLAGLEIAIAHGYPQWSTMQASLSSQASLWSLIEAFRDELSLAKCFRERMFGKTGTKIPALSMATSSADMTVNMPENMRSPPDGT
jgi:hypothetical protein